MKLKMLPQQAMLSLPDGSTVQVWKLGRGRYTTAWQNCSNVYLQVKEGEYSKEILCTLAKENNKHIPQCKELEWADDNRPYRWYTMPLYQPLTAKHKEAWADFKMLWHMRDSAMTSMSYPQLREATAFEVNAVFRNLVNGSIVSNSIKEAVGLICDGAADYGEYLTEISKKNCAVDSDGNLILLDPLFNWDEVKKARR